MFSALHLLLVDSLMAYKCLSLCGLFSFFDAFRKNLLHAGFHLIQVVGWPLHCDSGELSAFLGQTGSSGYF